MANTEILALECGVGALTLDEETFPDKDQDHIYDHLKYYLSKSAGLPAGFPAVIVSVDRVPAVIIERQQYFRIACEIGMKSIRAIVTGGGKLEEFLRRSDVRIIDTATIFQEMKDKVVIDDCHVFFFERPLEKRAKAEFEARIAAFFSTIRSPLLADRERRVSHVKYSFGDTCAEFTAVTPVGDESWYGSYLQTSIAFSMEVAKIASYQGGRFVW